MLVPAAANAGTALAIANAIVDMERDEAAGIHSIALALGPARAGWLVLGLQAVVAVLALATAVVLGAPTGWVVASCSPRCVPLGGRGRSGSVAIAAARGHRAGGSSPGRSRRSGRACSRSPGWGRSGGPAARRRLLGRG